MIYQYSLNAGRLAAAFFAVFLVFSPHLRAQIGWVVAAGTGTETA